VNGGSHSGDREDPGGGVLSRAVRWSGSPVETEFGFEQ